MFRYRPEDRPVVEWTEEEDIRLIEIVTVRNNNDSILAATMLNDSRFPGMWPVRRTATEVTARKRYLRNTGGLAHTDWRWTDSSGRDLQILRHNIDANPEDLHATLAQIFNELHDARIDPDEIEDPLSNLSRNNPQARLWLEEEKVDAMILIQDSSNPEAQLIAESMRNRHSAPFSLPWIRSTCTLIENGLVPIVLDTLSCVRLATCYWNTRLATHPDENGYKLLADRMNKFSGGRQCTPEIVEEALNLMDIEGDPLPQLCEDFLAFPERDIDTIRRGVYHRLDFAAISVNTFGYTSGLTEMVIAALFELYMNGECEVTFKEADVETLEKARREGKNPHESTQSLMDTYRMVYSKVAVEKEIEKRRL
ncbi:hypothetical protein MMC06_002056 [Schaereria dolodes]|nr:hypothetical protein [Schaereria dolodes]